MDKETRKTLFDSLEKEFCPTLDSSLIAALLVEIESDIAGNNVDPTQDQIDFLRTTLSQLAFQAEESQQSELSDVQLTSHFEETISSWTTLDNGVEDTGSPGSSGSSSSSRQSFSSPLGFLQAALPDIPKTRLEKALEDAATRRDEVDMWDIIADILAEESIREMEERGLDGLEEDDYLEGITDDYGWETVQKKKKVTPTGPMKKSQPPPKKIFLADIRQQHHVYRPTHGKHKQQPRSSAGSAVADPWTHISSLSDHIATLLPPHPPSFFQSYFHSPQYATSYDAMYAALHSICKTSSIDSDGHITVLYNLLDVIMPEYEDGDVEQRSRLISDVQLAVAATQGKGDESLDLVNLLRELDSNSDMGLYHLRPSEPSKASNETYTPKARPRLPSGPPPIEPPPPSKVKQKPPAPSTSRNKPSPYQWQAVPQRKFIDRGPHPLAHHIPAYTRDVNGMKTARASGVRGGKANSDSAEFKRRMNETMRKRNEALREATRMWQRGNSKTRGGEVAFYFAERAREFQELAKQESLNAARELVHAKRANSQNHDTVDLHGTTVAEAIVIVKEILKEESTSISQAKPLTIITGRGAHSLNQVSVLKPAVRKALVEDGWVVGSWDGGLTVRQCRT
ncbi:hypothetical protein GALMADRAFT_1060320 [Galerina marginata CBS 339.88]|uniref:Smr domain-containing protein n=1 Tax=Galerina marginata (strain CBS 339.88) TaxID=685588 RepID=A0A067SAT3_GALM3|nr:hypothetical protein GALMADRAFT_1060320 [Galerina marginata CBS 339.88]